MKKLITLIIAATALASVASAIPGKKTHRGMEKQLVRITAVLEDSERDLTEQKRAFLESRQEMLSLQLEVRDAMRAVVSELGEDATEEEIKAARHAVREQYKEQFKAMKDDRRALRAERRANREAPEA